MRTILVMIINVMACISIYGSTFHLFDNDKIGARKVNAIAQDSDGFLWIGTDCGLRRFDGTRFKSYSHSEQDSSSLNDNTILKIVAAKDGSLWIATEDGLHIYNRNTDAFNIVNVPNESIHGYISDVISDEKGGAWFIVGGHGLYHTNGKDSVATGPYLNNVGRMIKDTHGHLWCSSQQSRNIVRFNTTDHTTKTYNGFEGFFLNIARHADGIPVLITPSRLYIYNRANDSFFAADRSQLKESLSFDEAWCNDGDGLLLVSTSEGIACLLPGFTLSGFNDMSDYAGASLATALYQDRQSNVWIGTENGEVIMLSRREEPFRYIRINHITDIPYSPSILSVAPGENNDAWISLSDNKIVSCDNERQQPYEISTTGTPSAIYHYGSTVYAWENGIGLNAYDVKNPVPKKLYPFTKGRISNAIVSDRNGCLYIAVDGYGLLKYNINDGSARWFRSGSSNLPNNWITSLSISGDTLWIGHSDGVSWMNTSTHSIGTVHESSWLSHVKCYSFYSSTADEVWIGTSKGLCRFNRKKKQLTRYFMPHQLSDDMICAVIADSDGNVWFSTHNGINRLDTSTRKVTNFHGGNGIIDNYFKKSQGFKTDSNLIFFAGTHGLTCFNPSEVKDNPLSHDIILSDLLIKDRSVNCAMKSGNKYILDRPVYDASDIYLSHEDNTFSLLLSMGDFYNNSNGCYEYRLDRQDREWNRLPVGESTLRYHHLPPGDYELHLRARENNAVSPEKVIKIHVSGPWYSSYTAKSIYLILIVIVASLIFILIRRKHKDEINEARLRYFLNISHDIRSPLTLILSPLETLMKKNNDESGTKLMRIMHLNTMRIKNLIDQMLDIQKLDKGKLKLAFTRTEIVSYTRPLLEMFNYEAENRNIKLSLTSDESEVYAWIDVNNMDKILVNLISNAFKYTPSGGSIDVHISEGVSKTSRKPLSHYVRIDVADTGTGLEDKELSKVFDIFYQSHNSGASGSGLGLNICKRLVELHHGKIYASNRTDTTGCIFTIMLPQGDEHLNRNEIEQNANITRQLLSHDIPVSNIEDKTTKANRKSEFKILIVDDSDDVLDYLYSQLSTKYIILKANNGNKALELAVKENPDIIISDIIMPGMNGLELLQRIKSNVKTIHIPFIIISTLNSVENKVKGLKYGADGYINKPFIMSEIFAMIENLISNRQRLKGKYSGAQEQDDKIKEIELLGNDTVLMDKIIQIVNKNISNQSFNVDVLCKEIGISRGHLHRRMKQYTGISASEFIRNIRLKKACELLKNRDIDISQIAYAVGFGNTGYFATTFKRYYGITPTEFRNNPQ